MPLHNNPEWKRLNFPSKGCRLQRIWDTESLYLRSKERKKGEREGERERERKRERKRERERKGGRHHGGVRWQWNGLTLYSQGWKSGTDYIIVSLHLWILSPKTLLTTCKTYS
jgi:hypothetical protein